MAKNYLDLLPNELMREVQRYLFADCLHQIDTGCGVPVYPIDLYYAFCAENSDYIRSRYLNKLYADLNMQSAQRPLRERDYFRLLVDLERPTIYTCQFTYQWKSYSVRTWATMSNGLLRSGLKWNSTYEKPRLTIAGWHRLTQKKDKDKQYKNSKPEDFETYHVYHLPHAYSNLGLYELLPDF